MRKDDLVYVGHMLDLSRKAVARTKNLSRIEYDRNEDLRLALAHMIQVLGEAARRVSIEFQRMHPSIPWPEIIGMRHKIVHDYLEIDEDIIWDVVTADLPSVVVELARIVPAEDQ